MIALFAGGPLDGLPHRLSPAVPGVPERIVVVAPPVNTPGPIVLIYGPNLAELAAPVVGGPLQHVYEVGAPADLVPADPAGDLLGPLLRSFLRTPDDEPRRYVYRGLHPADDAPTALAGPHYVGPVTLPCHAGRTDLDDGCLIPPGVDALELREDDPHELNTVARAHACPRPHCGRLFLVAPTA